MTNDARLLASKAGSADPMEWPFATTRYPVRKELPARMMAAELSAWYYALLSAFAAAVRGEHAVDG